MNLVVRALLPLLIGYGALSAQTVLTGQSAQQAQVRAPAYVFAPSGSFIGIQRDFRINSLWHLSRVEGITPLLPAVCNPNQADCFWYPASMVYDTSTATAFAILPQKQSTNPADPQEWQVIAFVLPAMSVQGHFKLPACENPRLLFRGAQNELFVNYTLPKPEGATEFETVVDVYDASTLKLKKSVHEKTNEQKYMMAQATVNASFSDKGEFDASGDVILSDLSRIRFTGESFQRQALDPVALVASGEKAKLEPFYRVQPVNKTRWLPHSVADFGGGRALIVSQSSDGAQMAMWTVNLNNSTASSVQVVPAGSAHLIAHGSRVLVEKVKPAAGDTTNPEKVEKLGVWLVYDVATGKQLLQKEVANAKGRATQNELACAWPDGSRVLYGHENKLYGVELDTAGVVREIPALFNAAPPLSCIFVP
jgi:hypothetical protein